MKILYKFFYLFFIVVFISLAMGTIMYFTATDKDISGLPPLKGSSRNIKKNSSRFIACIYYSITILSSTGFGDILAISDTWRIIIILYMLLTSLGIISVVADILPSFKKNADLDTINKTLAEIKLILTN